MLWFMLCFVKLFHAIFKSQYFRNALPDLYELCVLLLVLKLIGHDLYAYILTSKIKVKCPGQVILGPESIKWHICLHVTYMCQVKPIILGYFKILI